MAGEFGAELNSFVPFIYWLHVTGLMQGRKIRTYAGMRPFYFFLDDAQIEEISEPRRYVPPSERPAWLPNRDDHAAVRTGFEMFPDYRAHYRDGLFKSEKPILVVHNKVTPEWDGPPVNVLSLDLLDRLFDELGDRYHIVYVRPGLLGTPRGYSADHQPDQPFDDLALLRRRQTVELFDEIAAAFSAWMSYNEVKLRLYAHSDFHVTVQGGNAHLLTMFSGGMNAIYHCRGQEIRHSYRYGPFAYAAQPRPRWLICRNPEELQRSLPLFRDVEIINGEILLPPRHGDTLRVLSPVAQCTGNRGRQSNLLV